MTIRPSLGEEGGGKRVGGGGAEEKQKVVNILTCPKMEIKSLDFVECYDTWDCQETTKNATYLITLKRKSHKLLSYIENTSLCLFMVFLLLFFSCLFEFIFEGHM